MPSAGWDGGGGKLGRKERGSEPRTELAEKSWDANETLRSSLPWAETGELAGRGGPRAMGSMGPVQTAEFPLRGADSQLKSTSMRLVFTRWQLYRRL